MPDSIRNLTNLQYISVEKNLELPNRAYQKNKNDTGTLLVELLLKDIEEIRRKKERQEREDRKLSNRIKRFFS